jgi:hypothetical protein
MTYAPQHALAAAGRGCGKLLAIKRLNLGDLAKSWFDSAACNNGMLDQGLWNSILLRLKPLNNPNSDQNYYRREQE